MTELKQTPGRGESSTGPRAIIHKKILDGAKEYPDVSMEELAEKVNGASLDLVEKVLTEYGDPIEDEATSANVDNAEKESHFSNVSEEDSMVEFRGDIESETQLDHPSSKLTEKQRETLEAIQRNPNATQEELGEMLGVTAATINHRVNSIDGFNWKNKEECANKMMAGLNPGEKKEGEIEQPTWKLIDQVDDIDHRLKSMEQQIEETPARSEPICNDPDLIHKIIYACIKFERISEEEELRILEELLS